MLGTLVNAGAIVAGSLAGTALGDRLPQGARTTATDGLGLTCVAIGLKMSLETSNILYVLGGLIGELLNLDGRITQLGAAVERRVLGSSSAAGGGRFARGFVAASLLFCVGPMAVLGSIRDGLSGDASTLIVKAVIDGFTALTFASSLGIGVGFSAAPVFLYQGALTLGARYFQGILTSAMISEFTATGGLLVAAIGFGLLEMKKIKVANLLPGAFVAPLILYIASRFK